MPFKVSWTEPTGGKQETFATAGEAHAKVLELQNSGQINIGVKDDNGRRVKTDDLLRLEYNAWNAGGAPAPKAERVKAEFDEITSTTSCDKRLDPRSSLRLTRQTKVEPCWKG